VKKTAKAVVALLLTFAAGCVDIIGFMNLYHTFTAHMTGVTVHLGQNLMRGKAYDCAVLFATVGAFVLGSVIGRTVVEIGLRKQVRSAATSSLALEFLLIIAVALGGTVPQRQVGMVILLAAAMGVQTATLTRIGSLTVHTTFVTGMLNKLAQLLSHALFLSYDEFRGRDQPHLSKTVHRQALFMFSIWVLYLAGAITGTAAASTWGIRALFLPALVVFGVAVFNQVQPMAIEEERDKSER
jgi:uncharacterized membrane protein YoaK (UPF0700 family)